MNVKKQNVAIYILLTASLLISSCGSIEPVTGTVAGTVLQDDAPASGITLSLELNVPDGATVTPETENKSTSQETKTDANGNYAFTNVVPGDYLLTLGISITNADINCIVIESVKVEADKQTKVDFSIPKELDASMGLVPLPDGKTAFCLRN